MCFNSDTTVSELYFPSLEVWDIDWLVIVFGMFPNFSVYFLVLINSWDWYCFRLLRCLRTATTDKKVFVSATVWAKMRNTITYKVDVSIKAMWWCWKCTVNVKRDRGLPPTANTLLLWCLAVAVLQNRTYSHGNHMHPGKKLNHTGPL